MCMMWEGGAESGASGRATMPRYVHVSTCMYIHVRTYTGNEGGREGGRERERERDREVETEREKGFTSTQKYKIAEH